MKVLFRVSVSPQSSHVDMLGSEGLTTLLDELHCILPVDRRSSSSSLVPLMNGARGRQLSELREVRLTTGWLVFGTNTRCRCQTSEYLRCLRIHCHASMPTASHVDAYLLGRDLAWKARCSSRSRGDPDVGQQAPPRHARLPGRRCRSTEGQGTRLGHAANARSGE